LLELENHDKDDSMKRIDAKHDIRGVARVTIDHGRKLNTLSRAVMQELIDAMRVVSARTDVRVVVLTGAGGKAFIGGADLSEMATLDPQSARTFIGLVHQTCRAIIECPVPVIARIDGYALGAGLEVAAACDIRIASANSQFAMPEVKLGIPSVVEAALLPRLIGSGRARWLVYTGEAIDARKALEWGLVEEVATQSELDMAVERVVASMVGNGPRAMRIQKGLCNGWDNSPLTDVIDQSIDRFSEAWEHEEPKNMLEEFISRRAAHRRSK
jgi:enoyl-CoA hydratase